MKYYFDSHGTFKPFSVERNENESEREFSRRTWELYCALVDKHETAASGNRVYMSDSPRQVF